MTCQNDLCTAARNGRAHRSGAWGAVGFIACMVSLAVFCDWPGTVVYAAPEMSSTYVVSQTSFIGVTAFRGAGSCSSSACHANTSRSGFVGREYSLSYDRSSGNRFTDKHAQAYEALFDLRSQRIEQSYRRLPSADQPHPETDTLCLRCHVHPDFESFGGLTSPAAKLLVADGVSCEACHGAAQGWLTTHFRQSHADNVSQGMTDTRDLATRIKSCVPCHVGAPGAEVDHDLIAAGHPWLRFEFSSFHQALPHHWNPAKDVDPRVDARGRPDFQARVWALGQLIAARTSLELLEGRARNSKGVWPEFADNDCFACHHNLGRDSSSAVTLDSAGKRSDPGFNRWYYSLDAGALSTLRSGSSAEVQRALDELQVVMEKPSPNRQIVAQKSHAAAGLLSGYLRQVSTRQPLNFASPLFASPEDQIKRATWSDAAQYYNARVAIQTAQRQMGQSVDTAPLHKLEGMLRFPKGSDSPAYYDRAAVEQWLAEDIFRNLR